MALEREIKLRFDTAEHARSRVLAIGATALKGRRLQEDALLDTADGGLRHRRVALRVRHESGHSRVTFKGPPQAGTMKLREEHETVVGDGEVLLTILAALGYQVWFRYEKYREEFALEDVVIAVDETPVGVFVEIEGAEAAITRTASALGFTPAEYLTLSYRTLFEAWREQHASDSRDMIFPDAAAR
jgi:adenylate cyclase class 2